MQIDRMTPPTLGPVCCSAGGVEQVRARLVEPMIHDGWQVAVTATPTAAHWLQLNGEANQIEQDAAHADQPAWDQHIDALRRAGVHLVYGEDVWPLHCPRNAPGKKIPWHAIRDTIEQTVRPSARI